MSAMLTAALLLVSMNGAGVAVERQVQITKINFATGEITLSNLGGATQDLSGWRFCSNNSTVFARYSGSTGLVGQSIPAGGQLIIHFNNDAPGGDPTRINRLSLGGSWAAPLSPDAYALGLYFPPISFSNGNTIADHVQWNIDGANDTTADFRSDEAFFGGTWEAIDTWIATSADSECIVLDDLSGAELHGPGDYTVVGPGSGCNPNCDVSGGDADVDDDCDVDLSDIAVLLANFGRTAAAHGDGDTDFDGDVDLTDLANILSKFGVSCL